MEGLFSTFSSPGPELFKFGPFALRWYGLLIALSVIIGLNLSNNLALKRGLEKGIFNDLFPFLIPSSIIGARLYYIIFEWRNYKENPIEVLAVWKGGIAIHGALIAGFISIFIFCKFKNKSFWNILDVLVPSIALGQAIGRWGNFFNNEAFGIPTKLPWKLFIPIEYRPIELITSEYFHPTFLYESLWNLSVFSLLIYLFIRGQKNKINLPSGALSCIYISTYSFGRFWIESLRTDPLCLNSIPPACQGGVRMAQLISTLLIFLGLYGLIWIYRLNRKMPDLTINKKQ